MINLLLRKILEGNLNEVISVNEIASYRFLRKILLKHKLSIAMLILFENYFKVKKEGFVLLKVLIMKTVD